MSMLTIKSRPRLSHGGQGGPGVRVYRQDPEGILLQLWLDEKRHADVYLQFCEAMVLIDAITAAVEDGLKPLPAGELERLVRGE